MGSHRTEILVSKKVECGTIELATDADHVAVRSEVLNAVPFIKWTVLKVAPPSEPNAAGVAVVNPREFGLKYLHPHTRMLWTPVSLIPLTKIVLVANSSEYEKLNGNRSELISRLPEFIRPGMVLPDLGCYVKACEPVDQGILPTDRSLLSISVFEDRFAGEIHNFSDISYSVESLGFGNEQVDSVQKQLSSSTMDHFLVGEVKQSQVSVQPLAHLVALCSLSPPVPPHVDPENVAFLHVNSLAKLGCFSGDPVVIMADQEGQNRRIIHLYSFPEPSHAREDTIYSTPMMCFNMGSPSTLTVSKVENPDNAYELAREVTLSRVSSPISSDKSNQTASLRGSKSYFSHGTSRIVRNKDVVSVPINTKSAKSLGVNGSSNAAESNNVSSTSSGAASNSSSANVDDDEVVDLNMLHDDNSQPDQVIWFQIDGSPDDKKQYVISPSHTRMVQSGVAQVLAPPTSSNWRTFMGLTPYFNYTTNEKNFAFASKLQKLSRASSVKRNKTVKTTILLKSSKRGAGKANVLSSLAAQLGIHEMILNAYDLIGDSDSKTLGLLKARLERAGTTEHCLVSLHHIEASAKKNDVDGKDTSLVNGLVDVLDEVLSSPNNSIILAATTSDPDVLAASVRNKFKFEVDVTVPTERERESIFDFSSNSELKFQHSAKARGISSSVPRMPAELVLGYDLRGDVTLNSLALQSAGLTPPDLKAIIRNAVQKAIPRHNEDFVVSNGGIIKLNPDDLDSAIKEARGKFSDSIGAPKIPNVGWKDVGGLDMVKGEILDTIDMPLKHPESFANGLKKRSGILFYGPPGTGKTSLAKAIATNFSLNFFSVKGPELLNMYIGESEANVRRVFQKARDAKPCVVFFDESDSVAPKRGNKGDSGGVMDRIVSQLLAELDGMSEGSDGVFVVGATNRPDLSDEALSRPGRFDKMLYLGVSDTHDKQRTILEALTRKFDLAPDVDSAEVAAMCPFTYTGADFYAMSSDAMLNAMTRTAGEIDARIAKYNEEHKDSPISIRKWFQSVASEDDIKVSVSKPDFAKAQKELVPSVSAEELQHYLRVRNTFEGNQ